MAYLQGSADWRLHARPVNEEKKIGRNTYVRRHDDGNSDGWSLKYHQTDVVRVSEGILPNGDEWRTVRVSTGGWRTSTTRQRIHHGLGQLGLRLSTWDIKGEWRILCGGDQAFTIRAQSLTIRQVNRGEWQRVGE